VAGGRHSAQASACVSLSGSRRVLILAPHPDDEIVACGLAAMRAMRKGAQVSVLYLTTGVPPRESLWFWQQAGYEARAKRRQDEAAAAAALLGLGSHGCLGFPSRHLVRHLDNASDRIEGLLDDVDATELWVTAFEGAHQDHDVANALAARFRDRLPVLEFAAYNYAGGRVRSNRFPAAGASVVDLRANRDEAVLKRRALRLYRSERGNLRHIRVGQEQYRLMPRHDYARPPHPGKLFRERFHWVPLRHPRIDFTPSAEIYSVLGQWSAATVAAPPRPGATSEVQHVSLS
jgi:LmbE family N-acetylglucosaminyl deacetylase